MDFSQSSEVDIAYQILTQTGRPIFFKDLITDVIEKKQKPVQSLAEAISEIYTLINMDSRFCHEGQGNWGLMEWRPPETRRTRTSHGAAPVRTVPSKDVRRREKAFESIQE